MTTFLRKSDGAEAQSYQISLIIIRMKQAAPQNEGFLLRCHACNEVVFRMDRDVWKGREHRYYPELANVRFYADAVDEFNAEARSCAKCGAAQERFPAELMGWRRYAQYVELANRARGDLERAGGKARWRSSARRRSTCSARRRRRGARRTSIPSGRRAPTRCRT